MSTTTITGIGLGAGDPDLITIKAINEIKNSQAIIAIKTAKKSRAIDILSHHFDITKLPLHEIEVTTESKNDWEAISYNLLTKLKGVTKIAFVTIGDPLLWSSFARFSEAVKAQPQKYHKTITSQLIPGITAASCCWSRVGLALDDGVTICTAKQYLEKVDPKNKETIIIYKVGNHLENLISYFAKHNITDVVLAQNLGLEDELVTPLKSFTKNQKAEYFSCFYVAPHG